MQKLTEKDREYLRLKRLEPLVRENPDGKKGWKPTRRTSTLRFRASVEQRAEWNRLRSPSKVTKRYLKEVTV